MSEKRELPSVASAPNVMEAYRDYVPPQGVLKMVDELLGAVPPRYLVGLQTIILTNQAAQPRNRKQQKLWSRNRKIKLVEALGYYSGASRSSRASITLHIDNIFKRASPRSLRIPFVRYFPLASMLYHEIGHHIHAEHNPVYEGKENVAEDWSDKLLKRFYRTHYWYLMPLLKPLAFLIKWGGWVKTRFQQITKTRNPHPKRGDDV
jgi:hypothetical protein